jgi:hypothetical protein
LAGASALILITSSTSPAGTCLRSRSIRSKTKPKQPTTSELSSEIEVVDEKVKVLLVSGLPSWDYQQVQRLLQRDPSISLSCWLQSMDESRPQEGDEPISRLPRSMEEVGPVQRCHADGSKSRKSLTISGSDCCRSSASTKPAACCSWPVRSITSEFITMNRLKGIRELLPVRFGDNEFIDAIQALASAKDSQAGADVAGQSQHRPSRDELSK